MKEMILNEYQQDREASFGDPMPLREQLSLAGLGIAGEAGEVADLIKKHLHHGQDLNHDKLKEEAGDVLWYVMYTASIMGWTLEDIARANCAKLQDRYPDGFSKEIAAARSWERR